MVLAPGLLVTSEDGPRTANGSLTMTSALTMPLAVLALSTGPSVSRRAAVFGAALLPSVAIRSAAIEAPVVGEKLRNLSPEKLAEIVKSDLVDRQFLATADFTREVYDESTLFTDEIDTYTLPKFIKGTSALFVPEKSQVRLVGEVEATTTKITFNFDEDLCFRIPFQPIVTVTGRCELTRDPQSGLITAYREYWDKTPKQVILETTRFR